MAGEPEENQYDELQQQSAADASGIPYIPEQVADSGGGGGPAPVATPPSGDDSLQGSQNQFRQGDDATNSNIGQIQVYGPSENQPQPKEGPTPWPSPISPTSSDTTDTTPSTPNPPGTDLPPNFTPEDPNAPLPGHPAEPTPPSDGKTIDDLFPPPGPSQITPQQINDLLNAAPGQSSDAQV
jgi:hypothetical protein